MNSRILISYGLLPEQCVVEQLGNGLINKTWKITSGERQFILQRINDYVFERPIDLAENISMLDRYLKEHHPDYLFVSAEKNNQHEEILKNDEGYYRLFPFVIGSHTIQTVSSAEQAFEASSQFGKFTRLLSGFDPTKLHTTISNFHNLSLRYHQLEEACKNGNRDRIKESKQLLDEVRNFNHILTVFEKLDKNGLIKHRVTHHDTKISNVLFSDQTKGLCVIDLDTVMPGYFISDVGDMMRTYLSPANEEEKDFHKIEVREDIFKAIVQGYGSQMQSELSLEEQDFILYSGLFLMYMQAIRFLTDYLNNDVYYGAAYENHNFVRAGNQFCLLKRFDEKKEVFQRIISNELKYNRSLN